MSADERMTVAEVRALLADAKGRALTRLIGSFESDPREGVRHACESARVRAAAERKEQRRLTSLYALEADLRSQGMTLVAGVDEVGRGALAGPLTAAAVVLPPTPLIGGLDDSKKLTPPRREELAETVRSTAVAFCIAHVEAEEVDSLGMSAALRKAVLLALGGLPCEVDHVLIDGLPLRVVPNETAVVKGDGRVAAIAAASIVAKVARDALMRAHSAEYPEYGFDINKGYGTSEHLDAIARVGLSALHRRSFARGAGTMSLF